MGITIDGNFVKCSSCGLKGIQKKGTNNWIMCDSCRSFYCHDCFGSVLKSPSFCTEHNPWGKWLRGNGTEFKTEFK